MASNQRTRLDLSRATRNVMAEYDRCPPALRRWLADAKLQWSPSSARRAWRKALIRAWGREAKAMALMDALEAKRLALDPLSRARAGDGATGPQADERDRAVR